MGSTLTVAPPRAYTFNRKNDNDMRGQLYHDVLRLQGHLPRVAGVPAIVS